ncbi:MAG: ATP-binding protein [Candidatus Njordarchaeales archaeon]
MEERLVRLYHQYNPWWEKKEIPAKFRFPYKRPIFTKIVDVTQQGQNVVLVGPRRVGKTVLLHQFIESLLIQGFDPNRIFYLAGDDPSLIAEEHPVVDAIEFLEKIIFQKSLREMGGRFYIIFDEVQGIKQWAEYFKKYIDIGYPICFLASGSSSIKMVRTTRESLVGRALEIIIYPFSFREFLELKYNFEFQQPKAINIVKKEEFSTHANFLYREGLKRIEIIKRAIGDYFIYGGFPETYQMSPSEVMSYLKMQVIERVLYRDIPEVVEVRNPYLLQQILSFVSSESGNIFNFTNLSSKFSARYETISTYLFYLESAFLVNILKKYSRGGLGKAKSWPKIHVQDPAIANSMLNLGRDILSRAEILGRIAEGITVSSLSRSGFSVFYWRHRDKEVDIILEKSGKILPIEIKYTSRVNHRDLSGISSFQTKYKAQWALIITEDEFKIEKNIFYLPLWLFLLMNFS